jgi:pilus assembly protein CpaF
MEKYGQHFASEEQMRSILTNVLSRYSGVQVDQSRPIGDGVLPNGERVLVVIPPVAPNGTVCVIRKQAKSGFTPEQLVEFKSFSPQVGDFMRIAVRSEANLVVVGPTGSGKTALVSALLNYIPLNQHLLTIEDTMELQIPELRSVFTQYKTRSNPEQPDYDVTIYSLLRASLRSFPKYLIVGETRGEEAWEMLQAMKSGHAGITTIHGKDGPEAISRLEGMMALADNSMDMNYLRKDIAQVMDLFIIQRWIGREELGSERRGIYAIYEITPTLEKENLLLEDMIPDSSALTQEKIMSDNPRFVQTYGAATLRKLFYYSYDEDKLLPGVLPSASLVEKFREHGLYDDYRRAFELD